jgi:hypothetical protein
MGLGLIPPFLSLALVLSLYRREKGCVQFLKKKKVLCEKRFLATSNLRYMHGVLNVDEIKN